MSNVIFGIININESVYVIHYDFRKQSGEWCDTDINNLILRKRLLCIKLSYQLLYKILNINICYGIISGGMGDDFTKPFRPMKSVFKQKQTF